MVNKRIIMELQVASPILGFENIGKYTLTQIDDFFYTLENEDISFTLIDPSKIRDYSIEIPPFYADKLQLDKTDTIKTLAIVVLQNPIEESVINFLAPVVVNESKKLLAQVALEEEKYPHYLLAEKIGRYL
jgi:flagellar assembly factor FliW